MWLMYDLTPDGSYHYTAVSGSAHEYSCVIQYMLAHQITSAHAMEAAKQWYANAVNASASVHDPAYERFVAAYGADALNDGVLQISPMLYWTYTKDRADIDRMWWQIHISHPYDSV